MAIHAAEFFFVLQQQSIVVVFFCHVVFAQAAPQRPQGRAANSWSGSATLRIRQAMTISPVMSMKERLSPVLEDIGNQKVGKNA